MDYSADDTTKLMVAIILGLEADREFLQTCERLRLDPAAAIAAPLDAVTQADISNRRLN